VYSIPIIIKDRDEAVPIIFSFPYSTGGIGYEKVFGVVRVYRYVYYSTTHYTRAYVSSFYAEVARFCSQFLSLLYGLYSFFCGTREYWIFWILSISSNADKKKPKRECFLKHVANVRRMRFYYFRK
jgi:hypothetical protein